MCKVSNVSCNYNNLFELLLLMFKPNSRKNIQSLVSPCSLQDTSKILLVTHLLQQLRQIQKASTVTLISSARCHCSLRQHDRIEQTQISVIQTLWWCLVTVVVSYLTSFNHLRPAIERMCQNLCLDLYMVHFPFWTIQLAVHQFNLHYLHFINMHVVSGSTVTKK